MFNLVSDSLGPFRFKRTPFANDSDFIKSPSFYLVYNNYVSISRVKSVYCSLSYCSNIAQPRLPFYQIVNSVEENTVQNVCSDYIVLTRSNECITITASKQQEEVGSIKVYSLLGEALFSTWTAHNSIQVPVSWSENIVLLEIGSKCVYKLLLKDH